MEQLKSLSFAGGDGIKKLKCPRVECGAGSVLKGPGCNCATNLSRLVNVAASIAKHSREPRRHWYGLFAIRESDRYSSSIRVTENKHLDTYIRAMGTRERASEREIHTWGLKLNERERERVRLTFIANNQRERKRRCPLYIFWVEIKKSHHQQMDAVTRNASLHADNLSTATTKSFVFSTSQNCFFFTRFPPLLFLNFLFTLYFYIYIY